jgi:hypothetical protein
LSPICITIDRLDELAKDEGIRKFIEKKFGSLDLCRKTILSKCGYRYDYTNKTNHNIDLADFFRFAFDGSGADNFYDAGSCIDGRLTSAWNCKNNEMKAKSCIGTYSL